MILYSRSIVIPYRLLSDVVCHMTSIMKIKNLHNIYSNIHIKNITEVTIGL